MLDIREPFSIHHFRISDNKKDIFVDDDPTMDTIKELATAKARMFLENYTKPLSEAKVARVEKYMEKAPQYRPLLARAPEKIDNLKPNLNDEQLDLELYKMVHEWDLEAIEDYEKLMKEKEGVKVSHQAFREHYERFLADWNSLGVTKLARYVVHRRATLEFLSERLKRKADDKYPLEEAVHEIIFPLKRDSNNVRAENMNLWILDERLAYHFYLASELPLNEIGPMQVDGIDRPDLLIFDRPFAFAETDRPFSAIVIVEFKRPMRDDCDDKENPIGQVYKYIDKLRAGKAEDKDGRTINVERLPIYAYIVCDPTPTLKRMAVDYQLNPTPENEGFFGYHGARGAYIEIISFDKLLSEAKKRNKIMFDKMGLDGKGGSQ